MSNKTLSICIISLVSATAWATSTGPSTLQGDVKDSKLQPVAGAEVHLQAKDGSGFTKVVRADANGHYVASKLPNTDYEVVLFVNGSIKASISNTKTYADKPTQLDFKLTGQYAANKPAKKHTHMVYVSGETGSHLGGHWVEVDDNGGASTTSANNLQRANGSTIQSLQNHASGGGNTGMGGGN